MLWCLRSAERPVNLTLRFNIELFLLRIQLGNVHLGGSVDVRARIGATANLAGTTTALIG